jgi:SEC-C motif domain protein
MSVCPCRVLDSNKIDFEKCCDPYLKGTKSPTSAESLMRSRYTAYVIKNIKYVDQTQINLDHDKFDVDEALKWAEGSEWNGLEVVKTTLGKEADNTGVVEFIAHYKDIKSGTELKHHETSRFVKKDGKWFFSNGEIHGAGTVVRSSPKLGRNDPCSCGSGKKFKKCCGQ